MRKLLALAAFLILPGWAFAQGVRVDNPGGPAQKIVQGFVSPIPGATITVCTSSATGTPCTPLVPTSPVTLCTDSTCSAAAPNPFTADAGGNYGFWAVPGTYKVSITAPGVTGSLLTVTLPCAAGISCVANGGPASLTNLTVSGTGTFTNAGIFSNTQTNQTFTSAVGGININTEYATVQGAFTTEAFASGVAIPNTSTVHQADGIAGYTTNSSTATNAVAVYGQSRAVANSTNNWGSNIVAVDDGSRTTGISSIGIEVDVGQNSVSTAYTGLFGVTATLAGNGAAGVVGGSTAFRATGNAVNRQWNFGFATDNNRVSSAAFLSGAACASGTCSSQGVQFTSMNSSTPVSTIINSDSAGTISLTPAGAGGVNLKTYSIYPAIAAPVNFGVGFSQFWMDSGANRLKMYNNGAAADFVVGDATADTFTAAKTFGTGSSINFSSLLISPTAPTIAAAGCGGGAASIVVSNGTAAFKVNVGTTPGSACTITMPSATTGWNCFATDITTNSTSVFLQKQTGAESQTSVVLTNFNDVAVATAFVASDILKVSCHAD